MELYPHQLKALDSIRNGCILNGGTGTGKSLTAVAYYWVQNGGSRASLTSNNYIPLKKDPLDLYIITTARKRDEHDWDKELKNFMLSSHPELNMYNNQITVDSWNNVEKYVKVKDAFFIFDEQRVVGSGSWARAFIKIARANQWILLSATPGDKWEDYIAVFVANGFYRNKTDFTTQHLVIDNRAGWPRVVGYLNTQRLVRLRNRILIDMEYNRKTTAIHKMIRTDYDKGLYSIVQKDRKDPSVEGWILSQKTTRGALLVGTDIQIDEITPIMPGWEFTPKNGDYVRYDYKPIESASEYCFRLRMIVNLNESKIYALFDILKEHPKVIVFYKYNYELDMLHEAFEEHGGYKTAEWNGHKHEPVPKTKRWVYFVQYTAGCEGWNCITTDTIVFLSQDYSYKVMIQACGRIDRLNTPFTKLYYYHFISKSSIDSAIIKALKNKQNFNEGRFYQN